MIPSYPRPLTATFVDNLIWNLGAASSPPNERNFLRAIHHPVALGALMDYLSSLKPNHAMRLTSSWVDRIPQAHPRLGGFNCELGDLLVVWRLLDRKDQVIRRVGWLLQAKMADVPDAMRHRDRSSLHEYALYEVASNWDFDVHHYGLHLGGFNLASDADLDPAKVLPVDVRHWNYLQIRTKGASSISLWPTPLQWRWDSGSTHGRDSFADGISSMMEANPARGAELTERNPQWTELCEALLQFSIGRNSRLANGPWQRTCMAVVPESWGVPALASHLAGRGAIAANFPMMDPIASVSGDGFFAFATGAGAPDGTAHGPPAFESQDGAGFGVLILDSVLPD